MNQPNASLSPSLFSRRLLFLSAPVVAVENDDDEDGLLSYPGASSPLYYGPELWLKLAEKHRSG